MNRRQFLTAIGLGPLAPHLDKLAGMLGAGRVLSPLESATKSTLEYMASGQAVSVFDGHTIEIFMTHEEIDLFLNELYKEIDIEAKDYADKWYEEKVNGSGTENPRGIMGIK